MNCGRCNKPKRPRGKQFSTTEGYCECGRPLKIDANVLQKLEDAFSNSLPDTEACLYAGIAPRTLYNYQEKNPEFVQRKEALKLTPNIAARQTIVKALGEISTAKWWLEKNDPAYKPTSKVEHGGTIEMVDTTDVLSEEEKNALAALRAARRKRLMGNIKNHG